MPLAGTAVIGVAVLVHLALSKNANAEFRLLTIAALLGLTWESLLVTAGLVEYNAESIVPGMAPYWIVAMWVLFATTLSLGFKWLKNHLWVAALVGGVGGPLAFAAGERLGAVKFSDPVLTLVIVAAGWSVLMPLMVFMARFLNGHEATEASAATVRPSLEG